MGGTRGDNEREREVEGEGLRALEVDGRLEAHSWEEATGEGEGVGALTGTVTRKGRVASQEAAAPGVVEGPSGESLKCQEGRVEGLGQAKG